GAPIRVALEKHWSLICEGHIPTHKDKVGAGLVRDFDVSQRSLPVRQGDIRITIQLMTRSLPAKFLPPRQQSPRRHVNERDAHIPGRQLVGLRKIDEATDREYIAVS